MTCLNCIGKGVPSLWYTSSYTIQFSIVLVPPHKTGFPGSFPLDCVEVGLVVFVHYNHSYKPEIGDGQEACVLHVQTTPGAVSR